MYGLAMILARKEERVGGEIGSIIQKGREIMHHLCPDPGGPVRIDPQPLTFADTRSVFHSSYHVQCVRVQACGCFVFVCMQSMSQSAAR